MALEILGPHDLEAADILDGFDLAPAGRCGQRTGTNSGRMPISVLAPVTA
jgi:hypothetical protein